MWEQCQIDEDQQIQIQLLDQLLLKHSEISQNQSSSSSSGSAPLSSAEVENGAGIDGLQYALIQTEYSCSSFITDLDKILQSLSEIATSHDDVTGRTNSLMATCENLLEQQHTLQNTVDYLSKALAPFNDIEAVAVLLGIPVDARGKPMTSHQEKETSIDPRSPEFHGVLLRLSKALHALRSQHSFKDSDQYQRWLEQLQHRATSLVARLMRDLLSNAGTACAEASKKTRFTDDLPLESAPVYQKFRGLGFRMRELSNLLAPTQHGSSDSSQSGSDSTYAEEAEHLNRPVQAVINEVKQSYVLQRNELLLTFVRDIGLTKLTEKTVPASGDAPASNLCPGIRHAYSVLLRVAQLEQQLFDSLFRHADGAPSTPMPSSVRADGSGHFTFPDSTTVPPTPSSSSSSSSSSALTSVVVDRRDRVHSPEVLAITEGICNIVGDCLRPHIIRESNVDELCRVVTTLAEDIRSQILAMNASKQLTRQLVKGLDQTVSDAQERLAYCAEKQLRQQVQMFEPLPSQLAYPEILEKLAKLRTTEAGVGADDVANSWYPPLRNTLGLLSKLYGVVEMAVFEDFARRCVELCVRVLQTGSEGVKRCRSALHGDLFLVRHLLILREQLLPFEIRLQGVEKRLDFKPTGTALSNLAHNAGSMWRFDTSNGFLQLALEGLPALAETQVDAKRHLDSVLKTACASMKHSALKLLLGSLDGFLAKVAAFVGDIPTMQHSSSDGVGGAGSLSAEAVRTLKAQSFMQLDKIKEVLTAVQQLQSQAVPDLRDTMKLYVENVAARTILLKPVQQEIEIARQKMTTVISCCVDPGQAKVDLEQLLYSILSTVAIELVR